MDPEVIELVREIGKTVEDVGRMLQTKRKSWLSRDDVHSLKVALQSSTRALTIYEKMIPKK